MQFSTTLLLSALSIGSTFATSGSSTGTATDPTSTGTSGSVIVHVVKVGSANGTLKYYPDNIKAAKGDMVQFQFAPNNHTVTQSTFDQPCQPIALHTNTTGFYSGFMPVSASSTNVPTYTIMINSTTPMWLYCSQGKHCQNGMTMVINENTAANVTRSLANFQALAKLSTVNLPGTATSASGSNSGSGTGSSSSSSASAETASSTSAAAGSESTLSTTTSDAASATSSGTLKASSAANAKAVGSVGGVLGVVVALLL